MTVTMYRYLVDTALFMFIVLARLSGVVVVSVHVMPLHRHKDHSENLVVSTSSSRCQQALIIVSIFNS